MSDQLKRKILELIELTDNPAQKAQLLVQLQMLDLLAENTDATRQIAEDVIASRRVMEDHRAEFGRHNLLEVERQANENGSRRVLVRVFALVQTLVFAVAGLAWTDYRETKARVSSLEIEMAQHKTHHEQEEKYNGGPRVR